MRADLSWLMITRPNYILSFCTLVWMIMLHTWMTTRPNDILWFCTLVCDIIYWLCTVYTIHAKGNYILRWVVVEIKSMFKWTLSILVVLIAWTVSWAYITCSFVRHTKKLYCMIKKRWLLFKCFNYQINFSLHTKKNSRSNSVWFLLVIASWF